MMNVAIEKHLAKAVVLDCFDRLNSQGFRYTYWHYLRAWNYNEDLFLSNFLFANQNLVERATMLSEAKLVPLES